MFPPLTYVLMLEVPETTSIKVGSLTCNTFGPGWFYYVGSAKRAGGHRLRRHLENHKRVHWHIDYLTTDPAVQFWGILGWNSPEQTECGLVAKLAARPGLRFVAPGFGTGDCQAGCVSHLLWAADVSVNQALWQWLLQGHPQPFLRCRRGTEPVGRPARL